MSSGTPRGRVRPTPRLLMWAAVDIVGVLLLALGAGYLVRGPGLFFASFPDTFGQALVTTALGLGTIVYAAANMLREVLSQMPQDS